jgi:hypothetical protein
LDALLPQARQTSSEILLVGPIIQQVPDPARVLFVEDDDMYRLRLAGIEAATGAVVAIGEDHSIPSTDWCESIIRAHAQRPDIPCVAGSLVNATAQTLAGRTNFLSFAAPFQPPVASSDRPPPVSAVTFKRAVLEDSCGHPGHAETVLLPRLWSEGRAAVDDSIVVYHYQDHGIRWSIVNAFHSARASYGYARQGQRWSKRIRQTRWCLRNLPIVPLREARRAADNWLDLALVRVYAVSAAIGGAVGSLTGPGASPRRVA